MLVKIIIFGLVTVFLLVITIVAQRVRRNWAWARFLVFELNVVLILLNIDYWIRAPLSPVQLVSWVFLAASLACLIPGVWLLIAKGKPDGHFERTTELVRSGVFRFIRHPMYASLFYLTLGTALKNPTPPVLGLGLVSLIAAVVTARIEEKDNLAKFGADYAEYMKNTKMFVPFFF